MAENLTDKTKGSEYTVEEAYRDRTFLFVTGGSV